MNKRTVLLGRYIQPKPQIVHRLPAAFQEVEYIQGDGNAYIDSGTTFAITDSLKIKTRYTTQAGTNNATCIIGIYTNSLDSEFMMGYYSNDFFPNIQGAGKTAVVGTLYTFEYKPYNNGLYWFINGEIVSNTRQQTTNTTGNYWIMSRNFNNAPNGTSKEKIYSVEHKDSNGNYIRNFVPCFRKVDNEPGLYDLVNNVFYTNQGTGTFKVGPYADVTFAEFQEVEYIESSTGDPSIDTNVAVNENTGVELVCLFTRIGVVTNSFAIGLLQPNVCRFQPFFVDSNSKFACSYNLQNNTVELENYNNNKNKIEFNVNQKDIKYNGVGVGTVGTIGSSTNTIYLFCKNYSATPLHSRIRLYSCKLYDNGNLIRNFVPCYRKSDGIIGLFDKVNVKFYANQGSGTFTKGPDVN